MNKEEVYNSIKAILKNYNSTGIKIDHQSELLDDLGIDSISMNLFIHELEMEFEFEIEETELTLKNFKDVFSLLNFVSNKLFIL